MPISTTCPSCHTVYSLADHLRGKNVRCKKCGEVIAVGPTAKVRRADEDNDEPSDRQQRIQTESRRPSRVPSHDDEDERPRRREREDWDEPEPQSNRGLILGLAAGCGALFVLALVGGGIFAFILVRDNSASNAADSVVDVRTAPPQAAPPPQQPALPGAVNQGGSQEVVIVHVSGVSNDLMGGAIRDKLRQLADPGPNVFALGRAHNGQMTVHVSPVQDAKAFAAKIDFGTVKRVEERTITIVARQDRGTSRT